MVTPAVHIKYLICNVHFVTAAGVKLIILLSQKKHNITIILEEWEICFSTNEKVKMITKNISAPWKNVLLLCAQCCVLAADWRGEQMVHGD